MPRQMTLTEAPPPGENVRPTITCTYDPLANTHDEHGNHQSGAFTATCDAIGRPVIAMAFTEEQAVVDLLRWLGQNRRSSTFTDYAYVPPTNAPPNRMQPWHTLVKPAIKKPA